MIPTRLGSLTEMVMAQRRLQETAMGYSFKDMTDGQRVAYIKEMVFAGIVEFTEVADETTWKAWAKGSPNVNDDAGFGEIMDVLCFAINCLFAFKPDLDDIGIANEILRGFAAKFDVNMQRQADGYTAKNKCPECKRALDDPTVKCSPTACSDPML